MITRRSLMIYLLAISAFSTASEAQNTRSWVASFGVDANDCTRPSPCRTFGRAIVVSNSGAEVVVMDSAGYGPVTIDKSISIIAPPSVHAAIAPTSGDAITIATGITGPVILRGLYLNGQGGLTGILQQGNSDLHVEGCVINGFSAGLVFQTGVQPRFFVTDTTIRNNDGHGITWQGSPPGAASLTTVGSSATAALVSRLRAEGISRFATPSRRTTRMVSKSFLSSMWWP